MNDLISRQAAIDALTEYGNGRAVFISVGEAVIRMEQLPSAQPERKMCNLCKYYEGVHRVQGHAPCSFWKIGGVMYDDYCSRWEKFDE